MFVLMDMEWVEDQAQNVSPTQLAAMRVDERWNGQGRFYSRICPKDSSFYQWEHMAYTGGTADDFLRAPGIDSALSKLEDWLRPDDVICFWHRDISQSGVHPYPGRRPTHRTRQSEILFPQKAEDLSPLHEGGGTPGHPDPQPGYS